jgi:hypothetical protein
VKHKHRVPTPSWWQVPPSSYVDPAYQAEVERDTARGEREYRLRQERLACAEERLAAAQEAKGRRVSRRRMAELQADVELRRQELETYRRAMVASPASAEHRGVRSYRPVPPSNGIPL